MPGPPPGCSGRIGQWLVAIQKLPLAAQISIVILVVAILAGAIWGPSWLAVLRSTPKTLIITVSNEQSIDLVKTFPPIRVTNASTSLEPLPVKGDSPVTVNVQAFNWSGAQIPPEKLDYHWELCCGDQQNKTPDDTQSPAWTFEPPTHIRDQTLTITVSNENGSSISAILQFTLDR
jgi:hypothetical protein